MIRPLAQDVLSRYDLEPVRLRLLLHEFNTSFRVDAADGRRFALRINVHSRREPEHLDAEAAWLESLVGSDVTTPVPVRTRDGRTWTTVRSDVLGRDLPAVLMTWLPGRDLDACMDELPADRSVEALRCVGRTMAALHEHAAGWEPPRGACLPSLATLDRSRIERLDPPSSRVLLEAADVVQEAIDRSLAVGPVIALHADLHPGNLKWLRRRIAVFDFDDSAVGSPVQDLAIALYYLRDETVFEAALWAGYGELQGVPDIAPADLEALIAGRNLQILHDVLGGIGAADRDVAAAYLHNTIVKMRAFLDSGRYRHDVPGLAAISL